MSTRATMQIETNNGAVTSYYKHHDGYIKSGLGEALMNFVLYTKRFQYASEFMASFFSFLKEVDELNSAGFELENFEKIDSDFYEGEEFKLHGDTEFHYTIVISKGNEMYLFVQKRDWANEEQNRLNSDENFHWTDAADKELIGKSGLFFDHKIA